MRVQAHPRTGNREQVVGSIAPGRAVLASPLIHTSLPSIFCVALGGGGGGRDAQDNGLCAPSALSPVGSQAGELQLRCEVIEPVMIDVRDPKGGT